MSIKTKIATVAIALVAVTGSIAATTQSAQAKPKFNPVAAGLLGAAVVGTTIVAATSPSYGYYPVRRCSWQPQFNMFGQFVGHAKVCNIY